MSEAGKASLARSAMAAVEPLVELFLELGITSPEAESLLRSLFVHKAREWLAKPGDEDPSDVRVALVTGVHRNFVRSILAEPPRITAAREHKGHRASRLPLRGSGIPIPRTSTAAASRATYPERDQEPSFFHTCPSHLRSRGRPQRRASEELRRAGLVQRLSEHRVRVRSRAFRMHGVNATNIGELGQRARDLLGDSHSQFATTGSAPLLRLDAIDRGRCSQTPFRSRPHRPSRGQLPGSNGAGAGPGGQKIASSQIGRTDQSRAERR